MDMLRALLREMVDQRFEEWTKRSRIMSEAVCISEFGSAQPALDSAIVAMGLGEFDRSLYLLDQAVVWHNKTLSEPASARLPRTVGELSGYSIGLCRIAEAFFEASQYLR